MHSSAQADANADLEPCSETVRASEQLKGGRHGRAGTRRIRHVIEKVRPCGGTDISKGEFRFLFVPISHLKKYIPKK